MLKLVVAAFLLIPVFASGAYAASVFPALGPPAAFLVPASGVSAAAAESSHTANPGLPSLDDDDAYLDQVGQSIADPLEGFNRAAFAFNDFMLESVGRPLYDGYSFVTPEFMRTGISNFFYNLNFPVRFVNNLFQGKPLAAGVEMSRFILNSTAGLGGLIDVAGNMETVVPVEDEDTGQTLGTWGVGEGFYIVWPLLGPKTLRDTIGLGGDYLFSPTTWIEPWEVVVGLSVTAVFNDLGDILDLYDQLKQGAVEPYSSVRDAYVQYRRAKILE
ncbi:MAG: VacJ family lipoprotein [Desulfovibrio sp.]|jgi:phospholipid-binding lipoprotein MlaA|nr:VacJ family lipoprotein [Desulfovibrio sp.]